MRKLITLLTLCLLVILSTCITYADEVALTKPVSLAVKGKSVSDVLKTIQKQTDVKILASKDTADQKVTIFVDNKPLNDVMQAISTLFGYEWVKTGSADDITYVLNDSKHLQAERERRYLEARTKAWNDLFEIINYKADFASTNTTELSMLQKQLESIPEKDKDEKTRLQLIALTEYNADKNPIQKTLYKVFCQIPLVSRQMMASGADIRLDTMTTEPSWKISADTANLISNSWGGGLTSDENGFSSRGSSAATQTIFVHFTSKTDGDTILIQATLTRCSEEPVKISNLPGCFIPDPIQPSQTYTIGKMSIDNSVDFSESLPNESLADKLQTKLTLQTSDLPKGSISKGKTPPTVNRSDVLALLHDKLGFQIVADHCSEWYKKISINGGSLGDVIDQTLKTKMQSNIGWDGKILYSRAKNTYLAFAAEVPNRVLAKWQTTYKKNGMFSLDDYADMVVKSTPAQQDRLFRNWNYLGLGPSNVFPGNWFRSPVIQLYGILSDKQRNETFASGTFVADLNKNQFVSLAGMLNSDLQLMSGDDPVTKLMGESVMFAGVGVYKNGVRLDKNQPIASDNPPVTIILRGGPVDSIALENPALTEYDVTTEDSATVTNTEATETTSNDSKQVSPQVYMMSIVFKNGEVAEFRVGDDFGLDFNRIMQLNKTQAN